MTSLTQEIQSCHPLIKRLVNSTAGQMKAVQWIGEATSTASHPSPEIKRFWNIPIRITLNQGKYGWIHENLWIKLLSHLNIVLRFTLNVSPFLMRNGSKRACVHLIFDHNALWFYCSRAVWDTLLYPTPYDEESQPKNEPQGVNLEGTPIYRPTISPKTNFVIKIKIPMYFYS